MASVSVNGVLSSTEPIEQLRLLLAGIPVLEMIDRGQRVPIIHFDDSDGAASCIAAESRNAPALPVLQDLVDRLAR